MKEFKFPDEWAKSSRLMHIQSVRTATSIGLLVMQFNRFEHDLGEFIAVFMRRESQENHFENIAIMTAALGFGQKLDLLSALYLSRYDGQSAQCDIFKRIISQLSKFEEYRNAIVHSRWGVRTFGDKELKRFKPNIKGRKGLREVAAIADWRHIRMMCNEMRDFNCKEMFEIYRGCARFEVMTADVVDALNSRITARTNGALQPVI